MRWDDELAVLFEHLEQQAAGLQLAERDAEVADRAAGEYAQVALMARLRASVGQQRVALEVAGAGQLRGTLVRAGQDWVLLETAETGGECVVVASAITRAGGLSMSAASEAGPQVTGRLGLRSVLRGLADSRAEVVVEPRTGSSVRGLPSRVGMDFVELVVEGAGGRRGRTVELVPFAQLAVVRRS